MSQQTLDIDGSWLWDRLQATARIGRTDDGGVARLAYSGDERALIGEMAGWARDLGLTLFTDAAANLFFRREGLEDLPPVVLGSHIDTQPTGGRYDGAYGVIAGLAVAEALHRHDRRFRRPIEIAAWMNEEGCRFSPGTTGSALFTGALALDDAREAMDEEGTRLGDELDRHLDLLAGLGVEQRPFGFPMHAFVEAHIEQGPVLEKSGYDIGIVTAAQGPIWYRVEVEGVAAHAGTTPRANRRDAVQGAMELAAAMRGETLDAADEIRFTIGSFDVSPSSINTVAERVVFTVDLRHLDQAVLDRIDARFRAFAARTWAGCDVRLIEKMRRPPVAFDPHVREALKAGAAGRPYLELPSGAFHDAVCLVPHCPTGMLFIPCRDGVSHHSSEHIEPAHALAGAEVLARTTMLLAEE